MADQPNPHREPHPCARVCQYAQDIGMWPDAGCARGCEYDKRDAQQADHDAEQRALADAQQEAEQIAAAEQAEAWGEAERYGAQPW